MFRVSSQDENIDINRIAFPGYPDYNGGAQVTSLEVEMTAPDASRRLVHHGPETECVVNDLSPGQPYLFHVRAHNRAGVSSTRRNDAEIFRFGSLLIFFQFQFGPWSEGFEIVSGAAAPEPPGQPLVTCRSPQVAAVTWTAPAQNGAPITDYRLEMCIYEKDDFAQVYHGPKTCCEVKVLQPNTSYLFRVQASNSAGPSEYSPTALAKTPPSAPGVVGSIRYSATPTTLALSWVEPPSHGSDITHYNIDLGDKILTATTTEHTILSLRPEANYRLVPPIALIRTADSIDPPHHSLLFFFFLQDKSAGC